MSVITYRRKDGHLKIGLKAGQLVVVYFQRITAYGIKMDTLSAILKG